MKTLTVNYELSQNDLQCCICLQDLTFPLIQCSTGNHFVCDICRKKTTRNCPVCRTSKLYHNEFLERHLQNQVTECKNKLCKLKMFEWTVDTHAEICIFQPSVCFFCDNEVEMQNFDNHLKNECVNNWIEKNNRETQGTLELMEFWNQIEDGIQIELNKVTKSFVVILYDIYILFKKEVDFFKIIVIDTKNACIIDVCCTVIRNDLFETNNIHFINSVKSLFEINEIKTFPQIQTDVTDCKITIPRKSNGSIENFLDGLIR